MTKRLRPNLEKDIQRPLVKVRRRSEEGGDSLAHGGPIGDGAKAAQVRARIAREGVGVVRRRVDLNDSGLREDNEEGEDEKDVVREEEEDDDEDERKEKDESDVEEVKGYNEGVGEAGETSHHASELDGTVTGLMRGGTIAGIEAPSPSQGTGNVQCKGDVATVYLHPGQGIAFDGWAKLRVLAGEAFALGYRLHPGRAVQLACSCPFSPGVCIEQPASSHAEGPGNGTKLEITSYRGQKTKEQAAGGRRGLWAPPSFRVVSVLANPGGTGNGRPAGEPDGKPSLAIPTVQIPATWRSAAEKILRPENGPLATAGPPPIVAICGGRNVGKSTFGQFLVNSLLNEYPAVAYLETDVGQPEMAPPGMLSLHVVRDPLFGPPFLHLQRPLRSHFFGDVSPKSHPEYYLRCVVSLYDYFRRELYGVPSGSLADKAALPLVINTHGWLRGVGFDVIVDILRYTAPTHVVQVLAPLASKNLPPGSFWEYQVADCNETAHLMYVESVVAPLDATSNGAPKNAAESRALRTLAALLPAVNLSHALLAFPLSANQLYAAAANAFAAQVPFQVAASAVQICHLSSQVSLQDSLLAVNGAVVGLCKSSTSAEGGESSDMPVQQSTSPPPECLGMGLVRGLDATAAVLYILTALPLEELQGVDILLHGRVELPLALLQVHYDQNQPMKPASLDLTEFGSRCSSCCQVDTKVDCRFQLLFHSIWRSVGELISPYMCRNSIGGEGSGSTAIRSRNVLLRRELERI